jgi:hypothetical protein
MFRRNHENLEKLGNLLLLPATYLTCDGLQFGEYSDQSIAYYFGTTHKTKES